MNKMLQKILNLEYQYRHTGISEEFRNKTKITNFQKNSNIHSHPDWTRIFYKSYPRLPEVLLPVKFPNINISLLEALTNRESKRDFTKGKLSNETLASLLYFSAGIKNLDEVDWNKKRRFYPSAGARYPLEIYPVLINNNEIENGIYHYNLRDFSLELLKKGDFKKQINKIVHQKWVTNANVLLLITAVFGRTQHKYGERGYRHIMQELGHVAQNIYLLSTALGLATTSIGGFIDDKCNDLLDIDGINESIVGMILVGNKKK